MALELTHLPRAFGAHVSARSAPAEPIAVILGLLAGLLILL